MAAALGALASAVLLVLRGVLDAESDHGPLVAYLTTALAFYLGVGLCARWLAQGESRRWKFGGCAFVSFVMIAESGGPGGFLVFGPSTVILTWLAIRG
jgi:hypothetical protein